MPGKSANDNRSNYRLLSPAIGQGVAVAQVIDLDVFDVVTLRNIDFLGRALAVAGRCGSHSGALGLRLQVRIVPLKIQSKDVYRTDWRNINVLNAFPSLQLSVDLGGRGSCSRKTSQ